MAALFQGLSNWWRGGGGEGSSGASSLEAAGEPIGELGEAEYSAVGLKLFRLDGSQYVEVVDNVTASLNDVGEFSYKLVISHDGKPVVVFPLHNEMQFGHDASQHAVMWAYMGASFGLWSLQFKSASDEAEFTKVAARLLWQERSKKPWGKALKEDEQEFIEETYNEGVVMEDAATDFASELPEEPHSFARGERYASMEGVEDFREHNRLLAVSNCYDRAFVQRGPQIGVFAEDENDDLQWKTTIARVQSLDKQLFSPAKMMLHCRDQNMLMLNPATPCKVACMDLERGEIVEEWRTEDDDIGTKIRGFAPTSKYNDMEPDQVFTGYNKNAVFYMDPRVRGNKMVRESAFQFGATTKPELSCFATTASGDIAVGSETGEIRMFSAPKGEGKLTRPKTSLPGLGDPIIGIDTTADGKWIVATTKTYLLLFSTVLPDDPAKLGFQKAMGKGGKPVPRRLMLKREHLAAWGPPAFTPARFDTGGSYEQTILTSTGNKLITWNLRRAVQGHTQDYTVKEMHQDVVSDSFKYGSARNVVVAMRDDVAMAKKATE